MRRCSIVRVIIGRYNNFRLLLRIRFEEGKVKEWFQCTGNLIYYWSICLRGKWSWNNNDHHFIVILFYTRNYIGTTDQQFYSVSASCGLWRGIASRPLRCVFDNLCNQSKQMKGHDAELGLESLVETEAIAFLVSSGTRSFLFALNPGTLYLPTHVIGLNWQICDWIWQRSATFYQPRHAVSCQWHMAAHHRISPHKKGGMKPCLCKDPCHVLSETVFEHWYTGCCRNQGRHTESQRKVYLREFSFQVCPVLRFNQSVEVGGT